MHGPALPLFFLSSCPLAKETSEPCQVNCLFWFWLSYTSDDSNCCFHDLGEALWDCVTKVPTSCNDKGREGLLMHQLRVDLMKAQSTHTRIAVMSLNDWYYHVVASQCSQVSAKRLVC